MPRNSRQKPQVLQNAREAILLDYLRLRAERFENKDAAERHANRGLKAVALAPTLKIAKALLDGERVYWENLDPDGGVRYGIRYGHRNRDGRYGLDDFNDVRR